VRTHFLLYKDRVEVVFKPISSELVEVNGIEYPRDKARLKWISYIEQGYVFCKNDHEYRKIRKKEEDDLETEEWENWRKYGVFNPDFKDIEEATRKVYVPEWDDPDDPNYIGPPYKRKELWGLEGDE